MQKGQVAVSHQFQRVFEHRLGFRRKSGDDIGAKDDIGAQGARLCAKSDRIVAQVAEVSIEDKQPRVHRVVCAIDCGVVVNPGIVEQQMESGIAFGLTAALYGEITLEAGAVKQKNFHDYNMLRMHDAPRVETYIVVSGEVPGGVGEPATPPIAPAVANALLKLTGKPVRALPVKL